MIYFRDGCLQIVDRIAVRVVQCVTRHARVTAFAHMQVSNVPERSKRAGKSREQGEDEGNKEGCAEAEDLLHCSDESFEIIIPKAGTLGHTFKLKYWQLQAKDQACTPSFDTRHVFSQP